MTFDLVPLTAGSQAELLGRGGQTTVKIKVIMGNKNIHFNYVVLKNAEMILL